MNARLWIGRLTLSAVSTGLLLLGLEAAFRGVVPKNGTTPFQPSSIEGLPYELRPNFETLYKGVLVRTNSLGFRDAEPQADRRHIALVGDSVTFGNCVDVPDTLPALLQTELRSRGIDVDVLNCGVPGYNTENVRCMTEARVLALKPELVVYVFVSNDVSPSRGKTEIPQDAVIDSLYRFPLRSAFLQFTGVRAKSLMRLVGWKADDGWINDVLQHLSPERLERDLRAFEKICRTNGASFFVASYPFMVAPSHNPFRKVEEEVEKQCRTLDISFLNLAAAFQPDENLMALWSNPFDSHPSGDAHAKTARLLASELVKRLQ